MNTKLIAGILALAAFSAGCNKSPSITTNSPQVQAEPFHGQVYRSFDGQTILTLISGDECELNDRGTTLLCKYTRQSEALRVVLTAMGTNQVIYYRFTRDGLQDNNGAVLLSPERYAAAIEQAQNAARQQRLQQERIANLTAESQKVTREIGQYRAFVMGTTAPASITVSDVNMTERSYRASEGLGASFGGIYAITDWPNFNPPYITIQTTNGNFEWSFSTSKDRKTFTHALDKAVREWKSKFREVPQNNYRGIEQQGPDGLFHVISSSTDSTGTSTSRSSEEIMRENAKWFDKHIAKPAVRDGSSPSSKSTSGPRSTKSSEEILKENAAWSEKNIAKPTPEPEFVKKHFSPAPTP